MAQVLPIQVSLAQLLPIPAAIIQASLTVPAVPLPSAEYGHKQPKMHSKQVKILSDKLETFIANKYVNAQLSTSGQKKIQGLLEKNDFKVLTLNKLVMPEKIQSSTQVFYSHFVNDIKDPYPDKIYEKSCLVVHTYNDKKKNLMLMHSPKIPEVSQSIGSCLATIIRDNDNDNFRFYLRDIRQAYIEIVLNNNLNFYIRLLSELISQLSVSFNSIVKVMKPLYSESEADNYRFAIYHPNYKEKPGMTESAYNPCLLQPSSKLLLSLGTPFDCCGLENLLTLLFLAHNGGA